MCAAAGSGFPTLLLLQTDWCCSAMCAAVQVMSWAAKPVMIDLRESVLLLRAYVTWNRVLISDTGTCPNVGYIYIFNFTPKMKCLSITPMSEHQRSDLGT